MARRSSPSDPSGPGPGPTGPCESVTDFGDALQVMVAGMLATMDAAGGVGLAANQLGVAQRVFVCDCPDAPGVCHRGVAVNPELHPDSQSCP
jgi:peptide deformylase